MTKQDEWQQMARQYLDFWQAQLADAMKDPELVAKNMALMQSMQRHYMQSFSSGKKETDHVSATSATGVSKHGDDELHELRTRIAALEARVARLESGTAQGNRKRRD